MTLEAKLPGVLDVGLARGGAELRQFFRQKEFVVFTFLLPAFLLVLLGSIFDRQIDGTGISVGQVFTASMIGAGIMSTSFVSMGTGVALDRENGTLKRLRGTPMPLTSYFIGKIILVAVATVAEVILLGAVGMLLFDLRLPGTATDWLTLAWVFALGTISCSALGIAASSLARTANGASAGINFVFLGLQFASGVYIPIGQLPDVMAQIGALFPLKWIAQGLRSAFLPDNAATIEMAGTWELGLTAVVLLAWCGAGMLLCRLVFRWTNRTE
ncbi:ABC transporter permease [Amycolatopsis suaedae]|uniref:Transport permease protein n=1 Tax=Amycolatopsis suaedae TaxID=2510978 RepID=A0A4Q7J5A4_9PSEU|nr:ABC transporter permease [Amycolatopsis suaedae]RZQ61852.1 ABC transporter permease [Amycolatopsis suaedae]